MTEKRERRGWFDGGCASPRKSAGAYTAALLDAEKRGNMKTAERQKAAEQGDGAAVQSKVAE